LKRRLFNLGGTLGLLFLSDAYTVELLDRGCYFPGDDALMRRGLPSACRSNPPIFPIETDGAARIASSYALSPDALWRQHS
jgi:hypothetical protein